MRLGGRDQGPPNLLLGLADEILGSGVFSSEGLVVSSGSPKGSGPRAHYRRVPLTEWVQSLLPSREERWERTGRGAGLRGRVSGSTVDKAGSASTPSAFSVSFPASLLLRSLPAV